MAAGWISDVALGDLAAGAEGNRGDVVLREFPGEPSWVDRSAAVDVSPRGLIERYEVGENVNGGQAVGVPVAEDAAQVG